MILTAKMYKQHNLTVYVTEILKKNEPILHFEVEIFFKITVTYTVESNLFYEITYKVKRSS